MSPRVPRRRFPASPGEPGSGRHLLTERVRDEVARLTLRCGSPRGSGRCVSRRRWTSSVWRRWPSVIAGPAVGERERVAWRQPGRRPRCDVLDEPTRGMDPARKGRWRSRCGPGGGRRGRAAHHHDAPFAALAADRVLHIDDVVVVRERGDDRDRGGAGAGGAGVGGARARPGGPKELALSARSGPSPPPGACCSRPSQRAAVTVIAWWRAPRWARAPGWPSVRWRRSSRTASSGRDRGRRRRWRCGAPRVHGGGARAVCRNPWGLAAIALAWGFAFGWAMNLWSLACSARGVVCGLRAVQRTQPAVRGGPRRGNAVIATVAGPALSRLLGRYAAASACRGSRHGSAPRLTRPRWALQISAYSLNKQTD